MIPASFSFSKVIPGGNPTIILHLQAQPEPGFWDAFGTISARLMDPLHIGAEQVGALVSAGAGQGACCARPDAAALPHLQMMGGEFCVNATRAAALLLALEGGLPAGGSLFEGALTVSGCEAPVPVIVCRDAEEAVRAARFGAGVTTGPASPATPADQVPAAPPATEGMPCAYSAALLACAEPAVTLQRLEEGVALVRMPGMVHLLLSTARYPFPGGSGSGALWRQEARRWRERVGIAGEDASGVVWHAHEGRNAEAAQPPHMRIWPAVYVRASNSEHLETACGSATLALAVLAGLGRGGPDFLSVLQPGGMHLDVFCGGAGRAWVGGLAFAAARGIAYLPPDAPGNPEGACLY